MQDFLPVLCFLFPSEEGATTSKSGAMQVFGKPHHLILSRPANAKLPRPQNAEELFNLRHASARNIIERVFGVLKWRFCILVHTPQFKMDIQTCLPPALAALHNFIRKHDPDDLNDIDNVEDPQPGMRTEGQLAEGVPRAAERQQAISRRSEIVQEMWLQYQNFRSVNDIE